LRGDVLPGNMLYSAVTQPRAGAPGILDFRHGGSDFSRLAVQSTIVDPASNRTLAIEVFVKPR
jgi:hypothetical protein